MTSFDDKMLREESAMHPATTCWGVAAILWVWKARCFWWANFNLLKCVILFQNFTINLCWDVYNEECFFYVHLRLCVQWWGRCGISLGWIADGAIIWVIYSALFIPLESKSQCVRVMVMVYLRLWHMVSALANTTLNIYIWTFVIME